MSERVIPPQAVTPTGQSALPKPHGDDVPARILGASGSLSNVARPVTLAGVITSLTGDGAATVSTAKGDVRIALKSPGDLAPGQQVEIDVAAGRPPRQAIIRSADDPAAAPTSAPNDESATPLPATSAPPLSTGTGLSPAAGPVSRGDLPVAVLTDNATADVTAQLQEPVPAPPAQSPLQPGDTVRLLALPPEAMMPLTLDAEPPVMATSPAQNEGPPLNSNLPLSQSVGRLATEPVIAGMRTTVSASPIPVNPAPLSAPAATVVPGKIISTSQAFIAAKTQTPLSLALQTPTPGRAHPALLDIHIVAIKPPALPATGPIQEGDIKGGNSMPKIGQTPATNPPSSGRGLNGSISTPTAPLLLTAQVVGRTANNLPVLSTTLPGQRFPTLFTMQFSAANLPVGTTVEFTPQDEIASAAASTNTVEGNTGLDVTPENLLSGTWPALDAARASLTATNPVAAANFIGLLPNANAPAQIPVAALLFIAAMRSGDVESWLGEKNTSALRQAGRADLLGKLKSDMEGIGKLDAPQATPDSWRAIPLPFNQSGALQQMALYYRHDRERPNDDQRPEKTRATRFIFDMSLTRLGAVQLDGLHRPGNAEDGKLDLIVRTKVPLSPTMQQAMRRTYVEALDANRQSGEISFQTRTEQWVKVR